MRISDWSSDVCSSDLLVLKPALAERAAKLLAELAAETADGGPAMLVGSVEREGKDLYNIVALLDGGKIVAPRRKHELTNYGTFDEKSIFAPGPLPDIVACRGGKLGLPIRTEETNAEH